MTLSHEKLQVYQLSIRFVAHTLKLIGELPRGYSDFTIQLRKSASSIPANIAEGVGRTSITDQKRFFAIARRSANESAAHYDVLYVAELINEQQLRYAKKYLVRIVAMLTKLSINSIDHVHDHNHK